MWFIFSRGKLLGGVGVKNFHTHTSRCMHASGKDEEYVLAAIEAGYEVLGFSDHTPWKYDSDFVANMRMPLSQFDEYYQSISSLKEKYKDQIEIKIGLECEYYPKYMEWLKSFAKEYRLDYLIFGNHYYESDEYHMYNGACTRDDEMLDKYVESTIEGLDTGVYCYLAHPDLFMRARRWDKKCEEAAHRLSAYCKEHDVLMEYNLAGLRSSISRGVMEYPHDEFWKIAAQYGNRVIIGVDAHSPKHLRDTSLYEVFYNKLKDLKMEIVEDIDFLHYE